MMMDSERTGAMRVTIAAVGENKFGYLRAGEDDFLERLKHYCKTPEATVRRGEWENLLERLPSPRYLVLLDKKGQRMSSEELAVKIQNLQNRSIPEVCFAIGGPIGFPPEALSRADFVLSLSPMTFTHEMTRLILLEQIYRAFTILRGEKYHK